MGSSSYLSRRRRQCMRGLICPHRSRERATFILTDGERKSGTVVFHTDSRENLIAGNLNLGTDDGKTEMQNVHSGSGGGHRLLRASGRPLLSWRSWAPVICS